MFSSMKKYRNNNLSPGSLLNSNSETNEDVEEIIDSDEEEIIDSDDKIFLKINNY